MICKQGDSCSNSYTRGINFLTFLCDAYSSNSGISNDSDDSDDSDEIAASAVEVAGDFIGI